MWIYNSVWLFFLSFFSCACCLTLLIFCCSLCGERDRIRLNGRSVDDLRNDLSRRVPAAAKAVEMLERKKHSYAKSTEKSKEVEACIICAEDFKETDEVIELSCDDRHIFHFDCITKWMTQK